MFIVFEGITSSGKTTQAKMLAEKLNTYGQRAVFNHEPTKKFPFGVIARNLVDKLPAPEELLLSAQKEGLIPDVIEKLLKKEPLSKIEFQTLYMADRRDDLLNIIKPEHDQGTIVIQDRYEWSTFAFGMAGGLSLEELKKIQYEILGDTYLKPDMTFYFDVEPETALKRLKQSGKIVDIFENLPNLIKIRLAYQALLSDKFFGQSEIIDANKPLDKIFEMLYSKITLLRESSQLVTRGGAIIA